MEQLIDDLGCFCFPFHYLEMFLADEPSMFKHKRGRLETSENEKGTE